MNLSVGDRVAIVAPASQLPKVDRGLLADAIGVLESWGLVVDVRASDNNHFYLAGCDAERAKHLQEALTDSQVRAIFCVRGGYGSPRLLKYLDMNMEVAQKILIGYSDITVLQLAAQTLWPQVKSIHGPNVATRQFLATTPNGETTRNSLRGLLFDPDRVLTESVEYLSAGVVAGPVVGGCLSMLVSLLGTRYLPTFRDKILFLEDTGEAPYRIDRMLTHLRNAEILSQVRGIVFGVMRGCVDQYNDLRSVIADVLHEYSVPIAFGLPSGHGDVNLSLPMGGMVSLDSTTELCRIGSW